MRHIPTCYTYAYNLYCTYIVFMFDRSALVMIFFSPNFFFLFHRKGHASLRAMHSRIIIYNLQQYIILLSTTIYYIIALLVRGCIIYVYMYPFSFTYYILTYILYIHQYVDDIYEDYNTAYNTTIHTYICIAGSYVYTVCKR